MPVSPVNASSSRRSSYVEREARQDGKRSCGGDSRRDTARRARLPPHVWTRKLTSRGQTGPPFAASTAVVGAPAFVEIGALHREHRARHPPRPDRAGRDNAPVESRWTLIDVRGVALSVQFALAPDGGAGALPGPPSPAVPPLMMRPSGSVTNRPSTIRAPLFARYP